MNINGINVFDYLSANPISELKHFLVKLIFQDKRLVDAIRWRLAYANLEGIYYYGNDLKLVLADMHIDSLVRIIYISIYDHNHFFEPAKKKCKTHLDLNYLRKEYDLYLLKQSNKEYSKSIEKYKMSLLKFAEDSIEHDIGKIKI